MKRRCAIVALACLFLAASTPAHAMYSPGGALKLVQAKNFKQKILDSELPAIVEFYAPWSVPLLLWRVLCVVRQPVLPVKSRD